MLVFIQLEQELIPPSLRKVCHLFSNLNAFFEINFNILLTDVHVHTANPSISEKGMSFI
jgi:hypothetical protein